MQRHTLRVVVVAALALLVCGDISPVTAQSDDDARLRARELGLRVGIFPPGPANAITDVEGVLVGQVTLMASTPRNTDVRTGITAILPHPGNTYLERVPAAIHVGNGYGKLVGITQVRELGELETPILLTCTLCVWKAADAMAEWLLEKPGMDQVRSINPVVGETNDGGLNDIRSRPVEATHVRQALEGATGGVVAEGSVGAGTGTRAFGWKGGVGTASRILPESLGGWTIGVLVQSNFGGILTMGGAPLGQELGRYSFQGAVEPPSGAAQPDSDSPPAPYFDAGDGSIMMVVATDAPLNARNLERLAARAMMGLARTGSFAGNGSGDYVIAFSTHPAVRRGPDGGVVAAGLGPTPAGRGAGMSESVAIPLGNPSVSPLFQAVVEGVEEAIYNSLLMATTVNGMGSTGEALPLEEVREILRRYGAIP